MPNQKRFAYRVTPEDTEAIGAKISGHACQAVGDVTELSLTGATVRVPLHEDSTFALGENVTLTIEPQQMRSVQVLATVRARTELNEFRSFGVVFPNPSILRARLSSGLLRLFNERHSFRVEPSEQDRVEVKITTGSIVVAGHMRDVSVDGIAALIDRHSEHTLSQTLRVNAEFTLPGQDHPATFLSDIRNRYETAADGTVCLGLRFDPEATPDFASQQRVVSDYVMMRQRELRESLVET